MSTSQKHRDFVGEPVGQKKVTAIPGIGPAYGAKLSEGGSDKAYHVVGKYLSQSKDQASFTASLKNDIGMSSNHANSAYNGINEWSNRHI